MKFRNQPWLNLVVVSLLVLTLLTGCATTNRSNDNVTPAPTRAPGAGPGINNNAGQNTWDGGYNAGSRAPGTGPGVNGNAGPNTWDGGNNPGARTPGTASPGANNLGPNNNAGQNNTGIGRNQTGTYGGWNNTGNNRTNMGTRGTAGTRSNADLRLADHIADKLSDRRDISNATVMLTNNNAYVAVDMPGNREGELTNDLKKSISREVKKMDKSIDNVYVSADVDFMNRMGTYARDIRNGRPIRGMVEEVTETIRRVFPTAH